MRIRRARTTALASARAGRTLAGAVLAAAVLAAAVLAAAVLLCFVQEKPLATTIERDVLPETLEIDGMTTLRLDQSADGQGAPDLVSNSARA